MTRFLILVLALGGILWLVSTWWRRSMEPAPNEIRSPNQLAQLFSFFFENGLDGAELIVRSKNLVDPQLLFRKYVRTDHVGIEMSIPVSALQDANAVALRRVFAQHDLPFPDGPTGNTATAAIDLLDRVETGITLAHAFAESIWHVQLIGGAEILFRHVLGVNVPRLSGVQAKQ